MNAATEWRDILKETCKSLVVLVILERIFLTRHDTWLEVCATDARLRAQNAAARARFLADACPGAACVRRTT
jgi:hypothetical protein